MSETTIELKRRDWSPKMCILWIKRGHSVPSQDYMSDDSLNRCFECSKMQLLQSMRESSHCRGEKWSVCGFPDFLKDNRQTNGCVQSKKSGNDLLGSALFANNFCWIRLNWKHPYSLLLFTFGLLRVKLRSISCHDVIEVFRSIAIVWQILWNPTWTNFFYSQMFRKYWIYSYTGFSNAYSCLNRTMLRGKTYWACKPTKMSNFIIKLRVAILQY